MLRKVRVLQGPREIVPGAPRRRRRLLAVKLLIFDASQDKVSMKFQLFSRCFTDAEPHNTSNFKVWLSSQAGMREPDVNTLHRHRSFFNILSVKCRLLSSDVNGCGNILRRGRTLLVKGIEAGLIGVNSINHHSHRRFLV